jgi:hypothetical protein
MKIKNIDGLSVADMQQAVNDGARFVFFAYTISFLFVTFKRKSDVYFIRAGENAAAKGFRYTIFSSIAGWWGFPWGPKYTIDAIATNLKGGKNITNEVMATVAGYELYEEVKRQKKSL